MGEAKRKKKERKRGREKASKASAPRPFEDAYERGDYAGARRLAGAASEGDEARRAGEVLDKIKVDPFPLLVFAGGLILISTVAFCGLG